MYDGLAGHVAHVHLSDYNGRHQHQPLGRGHLPLGPFLERLAARDYAGLVVVELTPAPCPCRTTKLLAELRRNLDFCRRHLAPAPAGARQPDAAAVVAAIGVGGAG